MELAWCILWIPFLIAGTIFFCLLSRPRLAGWLSTGGMFTCFILVVSLLFQIQKNAAVNGWVLESSIRWIILSDVTIEFGLLVNRLSLLMLLIVTGVSSLIFLYSTSYMKDEPGYARYFASLSLFAFSMLGIVLANNLIQIFIFWELVGVSSYLLISFWFEKDSAATAGKKAFLTTRAGDVGMLIGILFLFGMLSRQGLGTFNFLLLQTNLPQAAIPAGVMTALGILLFLGVAGKSAQMPLHVWLPDAMEGPTPVSALIHAATMVAAGVFLLARLQFFFVMSPDAMHVIAWTGGITAFLAGSIAIVQNDIKKILAYSTLSQLGYMVMALGLDNSGAGMFHLTTHAFFKALLFLGAGSLIHAMHTQDIWVMSERKNIFSRMPVTSLTFLAATMALMGIPFTSGFFSKEEILMAAHGGPAPLFWLAMITVFFTAFYMGRLTTALFLKPRPVGEDHHPVHESGWIVLIPLVILAIFSLGGGYLPLREFLGVHEALAESGSFVKWLALGCSLSGFLLAFLIYSVGFAKEFTASSLFRIPKLVLERKYFFDDFYDWLIRDVQENIAKGLDWFERIVIVEWCVNGTARLTRGVGDILRKLQTGAVQFYALVFTIGVTALLYTLILVRHP